MIIKSILLGIIQGFTEFLPISSSGHLVIFQKILGLTKNNMTLNVFLHFGTLIPIIIIFWNDIRDILFLKKEKYHLIFLIIVGIIPAGVIGLLFEDFFASLFSSTLFTGFMLLITGTILFISEKLSNVDKNINDFKFHNALIVGLAQSTAILPGISRSGSTIVASLLQGVKREDAARYSFLISVPVIFGAGLLEFKNIISTGLNGLDLFSVIAGVIASAVSGYVAIKYLLKVLRKGSLNIFAYYCWFIGLLVIVIAGIF